MTISKQLSKHLHDIYFGGNWTGSCFQDQLKDVTYKDATVQIGSLNTIAVLTYHSTYFVKAILQVLNNQPLSTKDEYSFQLPEITSEEDWQNILSATWDEANTAIELLEKLEDDKLLMPFGDEKYGNYFRNILGIIEHLHYHLGQIAIIKKLF